MEKQKTVKNKLKENKAITLIALIITIIVLLILAGVTIAAISGNESVLNKAQEAKSKTDISSAKEAAILKATEYIQDYYQGKFVNNDSNVTSYSTAGAYVAKQFETQTQSGNYYIKTDANTRDLKISLDSSQSSVIVEGTIEDNGTITWSDEVASGGGGSTPGGQSGQDETPVATIPEKLQVAVDNNGTTTYRKIYVNYTFPGDSKATKCVVMYSDAEHGVQIIPENPIVKVKLGKTDNTGGVTGSTDLEKAQNSYQNAVANLNEKAKLLAKVSTTQTRETTNIAQDARCVGSLPDVNAEKTEFSREDEQIKYVTEEGVTSQVAVGKFTANSRYTYMNSYNGTYWDTDENYKEDETRLKAIGAYGYPTTTNGSYYWLASRNVSSNSDYSHFSVSIVDSSGSLNNYSLWYVDCNGSTNTYEAENGFRPVILLKSGVQVKDDENDGTTADKAYNLKLAN